MNVNDLKNLTVADLTKLDLTKLDISGLDRGTLSKVLEAMKLQNAALAANQRTPNQSRTTVEFSIGSTGWPVFKTPVGMVCPNPQALKLLLTKHLDEVLALLDDERISTGPNDPRYLQAKLEKKQVKKAKESLYKSAVVSR